MKTRTILYGGGLIVLAIFLLMRKHDTKTVAGDPVKVTGLPTLKYEVPPIATAPAHSVPGADFDWLGNGCHCEVTRSDALVIDSTKYADRTQPGYVYVPDPYIPPIPPVLKTATPIGYNYPPPALPIYQAAVPYFWWDWVGLSRVIKTSDGFTLRTGLSNSLWTRDDGGNVMQVIQAIKYNGQRYVLDAGRSINYSIIGSNTAGVAGISF